MPLTPQTTYDQTIQTTDIKLDPTVINFGIGQPGMDILPLDLLREAAAHRLSDPDTGYLQYGYMSGDTHFRVSLADFMTRSMGEPTSFETLFLTGGNSKALDMICSFFTKPGDTIFVEDPTYFLALGIFADYDLNVVGVPMDEDGLRVDLLEAMLAQQTPAFVYTVPTYHNPTSVTLSAERREKLVELSKQHNFLIVADEVYHLLQYGDPPPASFGSYVESDTVLSLGTFSKILAPGLKIGWIKTGPTLHHRLFMSGVVNSGGSLNHFTSGIVRSALDLRLVDNYLNYLKTLYRTRLDRMDRLIRTHFPSAIEYEKPLGGYFFWLKLPAHVRAVDARTAAMERRVKFHPGTSFSPQQNFPNHMRLAFSFYGQEKTEEGMQVLGEVLRGLI